LSISICTLPSVDESYTILAGTRVKNRGSAHPIYGSIGWLSNALRQSHLGLRLMGLVPVLDHNKMFVTDKNGVCRRANRFEISRRLEQFFHQFVWLTLEKSVEEFALGGRMVQCGDGQVRTIVQVLALWITDRAEHELILKWNPHDCFHCDCASADRDCPAHFTSEHTNLYDSSEIEQKVQEAMTDGTYGLVPYLSCYCVMRQDNCDVSAVSGSVLRMLKSSACSGLWYLDTRYGEQGGPMAGRLHCSGSHAVTHPTVF